MDVEVFKQFFATFQLFVCVLNHLFKGFKGLFSFQPKTKETIFIVHRCVFVCDPSALRLVVVVVSTLPGPVCVFGDWLFLRMFYF